MCWQVLRLLQGAAVAGVGTRRRPTAASGLGAYVQIDNSIGLVITESSPSKTRVMVMRPLASVGGSHAEETLIGRRLTL